MRVRLANSERVNAYYQRELAELRRRCGISIDELEELDLSPGFAGAGTSFPRQRSLSRPSRLDAYGGPSSSSIRIPGAATSVSPPGGRSAHGGGTGGGGGRRSLASSFMFSPDGARSARFASNSYTSSINTTATTPSSSYPNPRPPAATPATNAAFSPASANANLSLGGAGLGFGAPFINGLATSIGSGGSHDITHRRSSLNGLVAAHFAASSLQSDASGGGGPSHGGYPGGVGIDLDDLVSLGGGSAGDRDSSSSRSVSSESRSRVTIVPPTTTGSAEHQRGLLPRATGTGLGVAEGALAGLTSSGTSDGGRPTAADPVDPLVAAITRGLAKLVAEGTATLVDESDGDEALSPISPMAAGRLEEEDGDGAETPLSNGASRTGSILRRRLTS